MGEVSPDMLRASDAASHSAVEVIWRQVVSPQLQMSPLLTTLAAVSFNDGHFPTLTLERRKGKGRRWQEVVQVKLQTTVLGGLSYRDFQLAVLMDIELARPG